MTDPTTARMLEVLAATFERDIAPYVVADDDGYTHSLCRTFRQMLLLARARIEHEVDPEGDADPVDDVLRARAWMVDAFDGPRR